MNGSVQDIDGGWDSANNWEESVIAYDVMTLGKTWRNTILG